MQQRVLRYNVRVSDVAPTKVPGGTPVLFDRSRSHRHPGMERYVDVWFLRVVPDDWPASDRVDEDDTQWVAVVGTGQPVSPTWTHITSMMDDHADGLVWHLFRVPDGEVIDGCVTKELRMG